jgi:hypothetical protein
MAIPKDQADDASMNDEVGDGNPSQVLAVGGHAYKLVVPNRQQGTIMDGASFHGVLLSVERVFIGLSNASGKLINQ